jgi:putative sigma-54 modulation protein
MNKTNPSHEVIVSGIHLDLTPAIKAFVQEKVERLFRHEERIVRVRVELECDSKQIPSERFTAKGHIEIQGPDLNASVVADDCYKSVDLLVDKLDGLLRRRSGQNKDKRNHPHGVEWEDVSLPKAM